jgi:hypothetical protein
MWVDYQIMKKCLLCRTHESGGIPGTVILLGAPFQLETIQGKWKVGKVNSWFRLEGIFLNWQGGY